MATASKSLSSTTANRWRRAKSNRGEICSILSGRARSPCSIRAERAADWTYRTFWYTNEKLGLGKSFVKQLFTTQDIFTSNEERQIVDFVARGRYPIAIGPSGTLTFQLKAQGLPVELFGSAGLQEGGFVTASNGTISVVKNAPHPNAAKLYLNYLLSNEGQAAWSKASGLASLRRDVPRDHIPEILLPQEGVSYQETYREKYVLMRREIVDLLNTVIRR